MCPFFMFKYIFLFLLILPIVYAEELTVSQLERFSELIKKKSKGKKLEARGLILEKNKCYEARFLRVGKESVLKKSTGIFRVNSIEPKGRVYFYFDKDTQKEADTVTFSEDIGLGKKVTFNVYYSFKYTEKLSDFIDRYGYQHECWKTKTFDECWDRVSDKFLREYRTHKIKKSNFKDFVKIETFIKHEAAKAENVKSIKTIYKLEKCPNNI